MRNFFRLRGKAWARGIESATVPGAMSNGAKGIGELNEVLDELDALLKSAEVGIALAERGVNISLALVAVDGVRAYLGGDKERAAEEFSTAAEEIAHRLRAAQELNKSRLS